MMPAVMSAPFFSSLVNGVRYMDSETKNGRDHRGPARAFYWGQIDRVDYRVPASVMTFFGSAFCGFLTYLSSQAAPARPQVEQRFLRDAGP